MKQQEFPQTGLGQSIHPRDAGSGDAKTRLFFDISSVLDYVRVHHCYSGIQRVVAMVLCEVAQRVEPDRLYITYVSHGDGQHYCVRLDEIGVEKFLLPTDLRKVFFITTTNLRSAFDLPQVIRVIRHELRWLFRTRPVTHFPMMLVKKLAQLVAGLATRLWFVLTRQSAKGQITKRRLSEVAVAGDTLVLLDSTWSPLFGEAFSRAHADGMRVYSLVHDLIPLIHPATTDGDMPRVFYQWLKNSIDYTDTYLANSDSTRRDLEQFLLANQGRKPIRTLPLAQTGLQIQDAEVQFLAPSGENAPLQQYALAMELLSKNPLVRSVINVPFVLCVGTIEIRKNIWRLLMAWKSLIDQGRLDIPRLVLSGRKGWMSQDVYNLLSGTGNLYGYVSLIEGPSDEDLVFLYRKCLFTTMPSLYEGWGLPVGEALSYGKTAVVSNSSSLPEVGQDMVEYCDPLSIESIAAAVLRLVDDPDRRLALEARIAATRLRTWGDVATELLQILDAPSHVISAETAP